MDINILKEIDITAFGKRFQVANAIKELKRPFGSSAPQTSLPAPNARSDSGSSPVDPSSGVLPAMHGLSDLPSSSTSHAGLFSSATQLSPAFVPALQGLYPPGSFGPGSTNMVSSYSSPHGYGLGAPADLRAAGSGTGLVRRDSDPTADARMSRSSDTSRRRSRPQSIAPESPASLPGLGSGWPPGQGPHARSGTGETFHTLDTALGRGDGREVLAERDVMSDVSIFTALNFWTPAKVAMLTSCRRNITERVPSRFCRARFQSIASCISVPGRRPCTSFQPTQAREQQSPVCTRWRRAHEFLWNRPAQPQAAAQVPGVSYC